VGLPRLVKSGMAPSACPLPQPVQQIVRLTRAELVGVGLHEGVKHGLQAQQVVGVWRSEALRCAGLCGACDIRAIRPIGLRTAVRRLR